MESEKLKKIPQTASDFNSIQANCVMSMVNENDLISNKQPSQTNYQADRSGASREESHDENVSAYVVLGVENGEMVEERGGDASQYEEQKSISDNNQNRGAQSS